MISANARARHLYYGAEPNHVDCGSESQRRPPEVLLTLYPLPQPLEQEQEGELGEKETSIEE